MNPTITATARKAPLTFALVIVAALAMLFAGERPAHAAEPVTTYEGAFATAFGVGSAGESLSQARVQVSAPASQTAAGANRAKRRAGIQRTVLPVRRAAIDRSARISLAGGLVFRRGKNVLRLSPLRAAFTPKAGAIATRVGDRPVGIFRIVGRSGISAEREVMRLGVSNLVLTRPGARLLRAGLGTVSISAGLIGKIGGSARVVRSEPEPTPEPKPKPDPKPDPKPEPDPPQIDDPYLDSCGVEATSKVEGNLPDPQDLPDVSGWTETSGDDVVWGFKDTLRRYVGLSDGGSLIGLDGATVQPPAPGPPPPYPSGFRFPATPGSYDIGNPSDSVDDRAVLNAQGTAIFCQAKHFFRYAISNPTIVIDGENSRIVADVDVNLSHTWIPTQRIDFAELDLEGIAPEVEADEDATTITWSDVPTALTAEGSKSLCGPGADARCDYPAGEPFDPITVTAVTEGEPEVS